MKLKLTRIAKREGYTIGRLFVNEERFCDTIEDKDRGLTSDMGSLDIARLKVKGKTAIPTGTYEVIYTYSPKFNRQMPLLLDVPGFFAIRIHWGNTAENSEGCPIVGLNKKIGMVLNSRTIFERLNRKMQAAWNRKERITIDIA